MIEVQEKWYLPAPRMLGWHIGLWNLVGAIGFTLCGALGFASGQPGIQYALTLSTFVGSWAFLVGGVSFHTGRLPRTRCFRSMLKSSSCPVTHFGQANH